jgi:uncharacterized 2Fe-2S/4Fe-4S cluster protein (DUF4445 family)
MTNSQDPLAFRVYPLDLNVRAAKGLTLRQALEENGIHVESPCDGEGICGQCKVRVHPPLAAPETPHANISTQEAKDGVRLACQAVPTQDVDVYLPPTYRLEAGTSSPEDLVLMGKSKPVGEILPAVQVKKKADGYRLRHDEQGEREHPLSNWKEGNAPLGLALDVGTTTLAVSLLCLDSGRQLASIGRLNPQVDYGHDVLTRIQKASTPEGLDQLAVSVQSALAEMILEVCEQAGKDPEQILDAVIGGNTTMLEICARKDPSPLGQKPFCVSLASGCSYPASRFGLNIHPQAMVYVPPIAHAFVGSDISAGLVAIGDFWGSRKRMLFLDVGTNGEMGLSAKGVHLVTSTAAGPAFEGSGLHSGMRAAPGAVQEVSFDGKDLKLKVIGAGSEPLGICGSGLLDLVYTLLKLGIIDSSGRLLQRDELSGLPGPLLDRVQALDGKPAVFLGPDVWLTQADIRQLQLAKGAVRTGIDFLLDKAGQESQGLERIVIGGGFGNVLRPASLEGVGMLPPGTVDKVVFAGNTSQLGCARLLLSSSLRRTLEHRMSQVEHIGLAQDADFMEAFVQNMEFPQLEADIINSAVTPR